MCTHNESNRQTVRVHKSPCNGTQNVFEALKTDDARKKAKVEYFVRFVCC